MKFQLFLFLFITAAVFFSCSTVQKNNVVCGDTRAPANQSQCLNLFENSIGNHVRISEMTEPQILKYIDSLVIEQFKIQSNKYENKNQFNQAVETFSKALNKIILIDQKYLDIFKQKFAEKWTDENIKSTNKIKKEREHNKEKQRIIEESLEPMNMAKKMIFFEIKPGQFLMGEQGQQKSKKIKKSFYMMNTQFTQMMWVRLQIAMGETDLNKINPSKFKLGDESINLRIENIEIELQPDHPIENVSWNDITNFIKKLNILSKSNDLKMQNLLKHLSPDHQKNDVYDLPTETQWEFVMRDRGQAKDNFFDKSDDSEISNYAWHSGNSDRKTHAVARKLPRMIDVGDGARQPFYDLEGNVWEWTKNFFDKTDSRAKRGGSYYDTPDHTQSGHRDSIYPIHGYGNLGFRLIRVRP